MKGRATDHALLSLVEPDMKISLIRLSLESFLPEGIHNALRPSKGLFLSPSYSWPGDGCGSPQSVWSLLNPSESPTH